MNRYSILILSLVFGAIIFSCGVSEEVKQGGIEVRIVNSAGTSFEYEEGGKKYTFLPYIINEGNGSKNGKKFKVGVIGSRVASGVQLHVRPIATLIYNHLQREEKIIIAVPVDKKYRSMEIDSYDAFITEYFASKQLIEYWYSNRYGLGSVSDVRWNPQ